MTHQRRIHRVDNNAVGDAAYPSGTSGPSLQKNGREIAMNTNGLLHPKSGVEWHEGHVDDRGSASGDGARLPSRPVDVFRDLGMTDEMIARYLWRWHCAAGSAILQ